METLKKKDEGNDKEKDKNNTKAEEQSNSSEKINKDHTVDKKKCACI